MATAFATRRVMERPQPDTLRKVLLVDENAQDLRSYAEILKLQGCDVRACDSFQEGKSNLEGGSFDLVIVSQGSPAFEARPLIERAVGADRGLPVFVVTGCVTMQAYLEAMRLGAKDYLQKPLSPDQLAGIVRGALPPRASAA
jgi:two-component system C4-dicarboxylate transport response regulator DctD